MTPRWERTRHLAHPIAMLAVDALFAIIWFSAFATQAAFNTANNCGGACGQSKAIVGLGVFTTYVLLSPSPPGPSPLVACLKTNHP